MTAAYKIVLTDLARAFAAKHTSIAALEERVRGEIADILNSAGDLDRLHFHTFVTSDGQEYICFPEVVDDGRVLVVDTCSRDETNRLTTSDGMLVTVPEPDSD
jgi:hypothetical protein